MTPRLLLLLTILTASLTARAQTFKIEDNALVLPVAITFEGEGSVLTAASTPALEHIRKYLGEKTYISLLRIEGHAPVQSVSEARAAAVAKWLVAHGIDCKRVLPVGFGATKPIASDETREGHAANTRITAVNAALRDRPIGGMPVDGGGKVAGESCGK